VSDDRSGTLGGTGDGGTVVVGLDDSVSAAAAVDFAAGEATVQGVPLRIVHAHPRPAREPPLESRALLDSALERVTRLHPDLEVQHTIVGGGASEILVDESGRAGLLVLGGLGVGELAALLTGSVLPRVLARAHCPVIVTGSVVSPPTDDNPVRVAVDGTVGSLNALRFGCDWALRHSTWVEAVHVEATHVVAPDEFDEPTPLELPTPAETRLDGWIKIVHREYPTVDIRTVTVRGTPVPEALVAVSHGAQIMAVGAVHRTSLAGLALGPVLHDLVHKAACPVAVVRGWRGD
jgi:nucleotide-binding universal stress UspA family protein